jgi:hypothetical protein
MFKSTDVLDMTFPCVNVACRLIVWYTMLYAYVLDLWCQIWQMTVVDARKEMVLYLIVQSSRQPEAPCRFCTKILR